MKSQYGLKYKLLNLENLETAYNIQKEIWPDDPDYNDLYDKATNTKDDNCFFLVYDNDDLIGITGVDVDDRFLDTIWLDWFAILPEFRRKGYGKKVLQDTIEYSRNLKKYKFFRVDTTYYENIPAIFLYDKVMHLKEDYTLEDTPTHKNEFLIYTYSFVKEIEPWNNRYLGLREYYDNLK